jgi:hypothetical protein
MRRASRRVSDPASAFRTRDAHVAAVQRIAQPLQRIAR